MAKSIYIHLPFCKSICPYCDFASFANKDTETKSRYLKALESEIRVFSELYLNNHSLLPIDSIFFGGGTPSIHSGAEIKFILDHLKKYFEFSSDIEITLEANPGTVDLSKLEEFKAAGVNRISIGAQTFNPDILVKLARGHTVDETFEIIELIKKVNFKSWSFDLIYGLPKQTLADWQDTLERALAVSPPHISAYALSIEPITPFAQIYGSSAHPDLASEEILAEMYSLTNQMLKTKSLERYEISNWSLKGHESKHNLCYWLAKEYFAFGLSAHGYFRGFRYAHTRDFDKYMNLFSQEDDSIKEAFQAGLVYEDYRGIGKVEALEEEAMLGLRLRDGIEKREDLFSILNLENLEKMIKDGYVIDSSHRLTLSDRAYFVSNTVISSLLL